VMMFPRRSLREKLTVAGIPESEHTAELLAARMPEGFNVHSCRGMSVDMMAELLLYLIAKGLVTQPVAGDKALLDMPWSSHVCQFYQEKADLLELLVPYFKQGLEKNEACVWMVGDLTVEEARTALAAAVPNLERYLASGQLPIRHYTEFYTNPDGTVKASDTLCEQCQTVGSTAQANGFEGLRASGWVGWVDNDAAMGRFMEYESKVHCAIQDSRMMAVFVPCTGRWLARVPRAHPQPREHLRQTRGMGTR
jgi:hypothetical protein